VIQGYGTGARLFHWIVAAFLFVQIPAGIAMIAPGLEQATIDALFILHKGLGVVLLVLIIVRAVWRAAHRPPAMPTTMPERERRIAAVTHVWIYVLLIVVAASGYLRVVAEDYPIELLDALGIPPLLSSMPGLAAVMSLVHRFGTYILVAVVSVHVAEVLRHHFVLGDSVLARMWPPFGERDRVGQAPSEPGAPR
jgi:cytochrome b561